MHLTLEQQADMADAGYRFEKKYNEAMGDDWREKVRVKTQELFAVDPRCGVCREEIPDVSHAILWEPTKAKPFLVCTRGECNVKALTQSMNRYMGRARRSA